MTHSNDLDIERIEDARHDDARERLMQNDDDYFLDNSSFDKLEKIWEEFAKECMMVGRDPDAFKALL